MATLCRTRVMSDLPSYVGYTGLRSVSKQLNSVSVQLYRGPESVRVIVVTVPIGDERTSARLCIDLVARPGGEVGHGGSGGDVFDKVVGIRPVPVIVDLFGGGSIVPGGRSAAQDHPCGGKDGKTNDGAFHKKRFDVRKYIMGPGGGWVKRSEGLNSEA